MALPDSARILDIGANRGDFLQRVFSVRPDLELVGVEPDEDLIEQLNMLLPYAKIVNERFENWHDVQDFDFILCLHTLEHASSALSMLCGIAQLLNSKGLAYIEVPSLNFISNPAIVEEFFIDKHSFHFDIESLNMGLSLSGLRVEAEWGDHANLGLLVSPDSATRTVSNRESASVLDLIRHYDRQYKSNTALLGSVSGLIQDLVNRQRTCIWGAGRIFDSISRSGTWEASDFLLVDNYLSRYLDSVHGIRLENSKSIPAFDPQVILLLTGSATASILRELNSLGYRHVITFPDLLQMASE